MPDIDEFVPDARVRDEFGISLMTIYRWDANPEKIALGWPPKIRIGNRNFRSRRLLEAFKENVIRRALVERDERQAAAAAVAAYPSP
jgi:hypothetical protein